MSLTSSDISRIATLARLELDASGSERMLSQLNDFFDIVQKMRAVDTTGVVPLAHPFETIGDIALRLRPDVASEPDQREANQRSAPSVEAGLFLVPKVIE
ncbi:Asp-tRNA(Asn)/Glu-tRNA(Gln) amidotransferase subunit GatC [Comamonadaceae bacterium G21597-S1]|nr:Asp-tRNA(Asn)/Glu-tRNA(Gln) amidotransferase subunit GatC [Comamonadaceae bacterium G21597-S1]